MKASERIRELERELKLARTEVRFYKIKALGFDQLEEAYDKLESESNEKISSLEKEVRRLKLESQILKINDDYLISMSRMHF